MQRVPPPARLIFVLLTCMLFSGCARWFAGTCARPADFAGAVDNAPLAVPPGLSAPDTRSAMPIPKLAEPERPRTEADPCLDAPPRYADPPKAQPPAAGSPALSPSESRSAA
jgi:hypothetical protein